MYDFSKEIRRFHDEHIRLTREQQNDMRRRRDANRDRLKAGLEELGKPPVVEWISQGGYAMKSMTQPPESDAESRYDIDMGAVFEAESAKGPSTTKGWVRDAIAKKATKLKSDPEAKPKCVRVVYADGYQCDFPVFRKASSTGSNTYEIAIGSDWIGSDPIAINAWFDDQAKNLSPSEDSGYQLRRVVRLLKYFAKTHAFRRKLKFPAGLVATAIAVECYSPVKNRDDQAFFETLRAIGRRSKDAPALANGTIVSDGKDADRIARLVEEAANAVDVLTQLNDNASEITDKDSRKAWKKVFRHSFFEEPSEKTQGATATKASTDLLEESVTAPAVILGLSNDERAQRAEAAAQAIRDRGYGSKPWSK